MKNLEIKANGVTFTFNSELLDTETVEFIQSVSDSAQREVGEAHCKLVRMERMINNLLPRIKKLDGEWLNRAIVDYNENIVKA